jgi:SAM-dependent methyltransferase
MTCRFCGHALTVPFLDLGTAPPSNAYLSADALREPERWYPLRILVCPDCWLVQTTDILGPRDLFDADYGYFSSVSKTWLDHVERFAEHTVKRFNLSARSRVLEIATNDGCLLERFAEVPCLGGEPTASTAVAARGRGIEVVEEFFGTTLVDRLIDTGGRFDLVVANNVLAHVPDIRDFVDGIHQVLKPDGVVSFEFPWLVNMVQSGQFDTAYHEHYSYLSLTSVDRVLRDVGLRIFDVQELPTHGGSLRIFAERTDGPGRGVTSAVPALAERESQLGVASEAFYAGFQGRAERIKNVLLSALIDARGNGQQVVAYGAAAKGNTLLNFAGVRADLLSYVADRSPGKIGRFMPGSRIPIVEEARLRETRPDLIVILPWNLRDEIAGQLVYARAWSGSFLTAVPDLERF